MWRSHYVRAQRLRLEAQPIRHFCYLEVYMTYLAEAAHAWKKEFGAMGATLTSDASKDKAVQSALSPA